MTRRMMVPLLAVATLAGCGARKETKEPKRYAMKGEVKALDPNTRMATIDAGKIGDWMDPMTMDYSVKPDSEFQKLHVGDRIEATVVVVSDSSYYVTDVKVAPK